MSDRWRQLSTCKLETLSLAASVAAILLGSIAFWLSQPAYLFNGGASSYASAIEVPQHRKSPSPVHGLLSLELLSAMQRESHKLMPRRSVNVPTFWERNISITVSPASRHVRSCSACPSRATAR
jgi:hypothetical protein